MFMKKGIVVSLLGGFVLGRAGEAIFGSETAKKVYTKAATGAFIAKDCIMEEVEKIQAAAMDIAADARIEADEYQAAKDEEYKAFTEASVQEEVSGADTDEA